MSEPTSVPQTARIIGLLGICLFADMEAFYPIFLLLVLRSRGLRAYYAGA